MTIGPGPSSRAAKSGSTKHAGRMSTSNKTSGPSPPPKSVVREVLYFKSAINADAPPSEEHLLSQGFEGGSLELSEQDRRTVPNDRGCVLDVGVGIFRTSGRVTIGFRQSPAEIKSIFVKEFKSAK